MQKLIFFLVILSAAFAHAQSGFGPDGQMILEQDFKKLQFPQDLEKTNLRITPSTVENPFEWAGRIQATRLGSVFPCSGGVVALPGFRPQDKALVLTAGHCMNFGEAEHLRPHEVLLNYPLDGEVYFDFARSRQTKDDSGNLASSKYYTFKRVIFASFDVVDLALLEMNETYEQLQFGEKKPPMLVRHAFKMNEEITAFGIPAAENYQSVRFHMSKCSTSGHFTYHTDYGNVETTDSGYDMTRRVYMNCTMFGGMSGGYVRNTKGQVIGVNSGVLRDGPSFYAGTAPLMNCATKDGRFNEKCLAALKAKIETWKGKPNKP
jgi:hypothetical protein